MRTILERHPEAKTVCPLHEAAWIGAPLEGTGQTAPPVPLLRRRFCLERRPAAAQLFITALGVYEPWLNGQRVGDTELRPGWTNYRKRLLYQVHDVTAQLVIGDNTLGALLGDGWYCGKVGPCERGIAYGQRPALRAALVITYDNGQTMRFVTDEQWQWRTGPILSSDMQDGERYDACKEIHGWCDAGAEDDAGWSSVALCQPLVSPLLIPGAAPPVRVTEQLRPVADPVRYNRPWGHVSFVFDLGQNFAGKVQLRVKGPAGATLKLRHAEVLTPDGQALDTSNLRTVEAVDHYTLGGNPQGETWSPRFTFHGFRYVEVSFAEYWISDQAPIKIEPFDRATLTGLVMHNDMRRTGSFETGHALLNRLQQNIIWGQRSNFLEAPTDCPQRDERLGWTGDAQVFAPTATFNYDVSGFFSKWLDDMADSQNPDGGIPFVIPNVLTQEDAGAGWSDAVVLIPQTLYRAYGDRDLLARHYDTMKRWIDFQTRTAIDGVRGCEEAGIFTGFGDWLALDGDDQINPFKNATPKHLIGTAYHARSLAAFARLADVLDHHDDAAQARRQRDVAIAAFNRLFVTNGRVNVRSQTAHLMALAFDLLSQTHRSQVFADLLALLAERDCHLSTGFLGASLWCDVLTRFDRFDLACDLLLTETYPGWLYPVTLGATTMWERWNSWHPEKGFVDLTMNSLNHYAYGAVGDWMYRTIAGINVRMDEPVHRLRLSPHPDARLKHCRASYDSPLGLIESEWTCEGEDVRYRFLVPDGTTAELTLPGGEPRTLQAGSSEHHQKMKRLG